MSWAYRKPPTGWQHRDALSGHVASPELSPPAAHRRRATVLAAVVVVGVGLVSGSRSLAPSSASVESPPPVSEPPAVSGPVGEEDGVVPDGVTVFDDDVPAVSDLDPALLAALRQAATDAASDDTTLTVTSGWRSPAYQERLLRDAVAEYGSAAEAARWVATPETSAHVSGDAVDMGLEAAAWLSQHGARYGLCQIYRNEPWHYELRPDAVDHQCPPMFADPTHDPRMQRSASPQ
jgi:hypothetical protein